MASNTQYGVINPSSEQVIRTFGYSWDALSFARRSAARSKNPRDVCAVDTKNKTREIVATALTYDMYEVPLEGRSHFWNDNGDIVQ